MGLSNYPDGMTASDWKHVEGYAEGSDDDIQCAHCEYSGYTEFGIDGEDIFWDCVECGESNSMEDPHLPY